MDKVQLHRKYSIFLGVLLSGYNVADKLYGAVFIILMSLRGVDPFQISIVFAVSSLSLAVFDYPSGNLSDLYGRKRMTALGFIIWGAGLGIFAAAGGLGLFIVSSVVMSLGIALISGSPQAWYFDEMEKLGMADYPKIALPRISGFVSAFAIVGALLGTLSSSIHYYLPVAAAGVLAAALGVYAWLRFADNYGSRTESSIAKEVYASSVQFIRSAEMRFILLRSILTHMALLAFLLSWQVYGVNQLKLPVNSLGILLVLFMAVISAASFLVSYLARRGVASIRIIISGTLISALGLLLVGLFPYKIIFIAGLLLFEFGLGMDKSSSGVWIQDFIPGSKRATFTSGLSALQSLAGFLITLLLGMMAEHLGYAFIWFFAAGALLVSNIVLLYFNSRFSRIGSQPVPQDVPQVS
ncbi:MFS transporter [Paenibacillus sp. MMS20-IR301]|uniref:MFS transporter n=1 Tax=Paenibacillus sp. MMS20-IR301 TaxID=2895946 RepID=UPI0028E4C93A|nr:MFS transporter [Paenibacillus sp. MMS20-IR301]WNS44906.1 MFS transporter [Paenibacillus sp. MMS20-IR301]